MDILVYYLRGNGQKRIMNYFYMIRFLEYSFKGFVQSDGLRMTRFPNELNLKWDYHLVSDEAYPFIVW